MSIKTAIIAHRGASGYAPENTMAAFELALEQGADGIETDVHLTRDGKLVLTHDPVLGRTIPGEGALKEHSLAELKERDCGAWFSDKYAGEKIPELRDLLDLVKQKDILLNIEIKMGAPYYTGLEEKLAKELEDADMADRVIISSFNHYAVLLMKDINPAIAGGYLTSAMLIDGADYVKRNRGQALHPDFHGVTGDLTESCHSRGVKVYTYTVNEESEARRLLECGVDGIITNYPDRMITTARDFYS